MSQVFKLDNEAITDAGSVLTHYCFGNSKASGWWTSPHTGVDLTEPVTMKALNIVPLKLALIHSEISEGLEGYRKGKMDDHLAHRQMLEVELADAVIRIFDLAGALGYDLGSAIAEKLIYNSQRADHRLESRAETGGKAF